MPLEDHAEQVLDLLNALGAVAVVNAAGSVSSGGVTIPDPTTAARTTVTLAQASTTITLPTPKTGKQVVVLVTQDGTGSRTVTWTTPSGAVKWPGAAAPTLTTTAGATDLFTFICHDGTNWHGTVQLHVG